MASTWNSLILHAVVELSIIVLCREGHDRDVKIVFIYLYLLIKYSRALKAPGVK
jgi:hypothetical protein